MSIFREIRGRLGFGTLRLPETKDGMVDIPVFSSMVDCYLENGFNYFDVAFAYMGGKCEESIRESLVKRHSRESFVLTDKLTWAFFNKEEDIRPFFQHQLENCGVEYFDFYLMHALTRKRYEKFKRCHAFEVAQALKEEGKIRHLGISFHDKADFLEELLSEHPEIEVVQIQFNYVDYEAPAIDSRKVYEVCRKFQKPIFVMEPVKGGSLQRLPHEAGAVFDKLNKKNGTGHSYASYALRFAAGFDGIEVVLSGMNALEQVKENVLSLRGGQLSEEEHRAVRQVRGIFNSKSLIQCTACRYCTEECPKKILIPDIFSCLNQKRIFNDWNQGYYYEHVLTANNPKASACLKCGRCEMACPQHLPIRKLLEDAVEEFEPKIADMNPLDMSFPYVRWAVSNGVCFMGPEHKFRPADPVSRLDIIVYLWRMADRPVYQGNHFAIKDIPADFRFRDAIEWGLANKIMFLDSAENFYPYRYCTRLDVIAYIYRRAGYPQVVLRDNVVLDYHDKHFLGNVIWAVEKGIVILDEGRFYPFEKISRSTMAGYLCRSVLSGKV